jgi:hypothetical protein
VVNIYIGKQKVVWILKLRENDWEAAASALTDQWIVGEDRQTISKPQTKVNIPAPYLHILVEVGEPKPLLVFCFCLPPHRKCQFQPLLLPASC